MSDDMQSKKVWRNMDRYREYQRAYQKAHYEPGCRSADKKEYYKNNKEKILANQRYNVIAIQFRSILTSI